MSQSSREYLGEAVSAMGIERVEGRGAGRYAIKLGAALRQVLARSAIACTSPGGGFQRLPRLGAVDTPALSSGFDLGLSPCQPPPLHMTPEGDFA